MKLSIFSCVRVIYISFPVNGEFVTFACVSVDLLVVFLLTCKAGDFRAEPRTKTADLRPLPRGRWSRQTPGSTQSPPSQLGASTPGAFPSRIPQASFYLELSLLRVPICFTPTQRRPWPLLGQFAPHSHSLSRWGDCGVWWGCGASLPSFATWLPQAKLFSFSVLRFPQL